MISHPALYNIYARLTAVSVAGIWQGAVFVLLATGLLRLVPRASANLKHTLLVTIFVFAGILPWLHLGTLHAHAVNQHALQLPPWVAATIAGIWLAVALIRVSGLVAAWRHLQSIRQRALPFALEGIDRYSAGNRHALLCTSSEVDSPTILGFLQPRLVLPDWMAPQLTVADLHQIALHECEHLRRHDDWLNLLLQMGLVLSPLNPALVWLDRHVGIQRELACDAAVVAATAQPIAYATCLTRLAEQRFHRNRLVLALAAMGRMSELGQRVHALLDQPAAWTRQQSKLAGGAIAALLVVCAIGLAHIPLSIRIAATSQSATSQTATSQTAALTAPTILASANASRSRSSFGTAIPHDLHAVPASFMLKPVVAKAFARHMDRKQPLPYTADLDTARIAPEQPHMVSARATNFSHRIYRIADFQVDDNEMPARFVTVEFSSPYVALPVGDGWLVFQL